MLQSLLLLLRPVIKLVVVSVLLLICIASGQGKKKTEKNLQSTWISFWNGFGLKWFQPELCAVFVVFSAVDFSFSLNFFLSFCLAATCKNIYWPACVCVRLLFWLLFLFSLLGQLQFLEFLLLFPKSWEIRDICGALVIITYFWIGKILLRNPPISRSGILIHVVAIY